MKNEIPFSQECHPEKKESLGDSSFSDVNHESAKLSESTALRRFRLE